jgi:xylulokinase
MTRSLPGPLLAGVDAGSTHCKALLCTADGTVVARSQTPTDTADLAGTALDALAECVRSAGGRAPESVGITGMAESGVPLDRDGRPLGPLLMWSDPAPAAHADRLARAYGPAALHARTGVLPGAKVPLARWHWLRSEHPQRLARMRTWAGAADLVGHALTGRTGTDGTLAQRTMAWDPAAGRWHAELLADAGLTPERMPHVHRPGDPVGRVTPQAAARTGLRPGTPVVVAGHDHLVGAWTAGARGPGCVADSMGTAEAVVTVSAAPPDRAAAAREGMSWGRHADGAHFVTVAGMSSSGALVEWFCDRFLPRLADAPRAQRYAAFARLVGDGDMPTGLTVEPYLHGRSAPHPDPDARLAVHGIGVHHGLPELARALLEGAAHQARWMTDVQYRLTGHPPKTVTLLGGSTRLHAWTVLKAAVTPWPTEVCEEPEAPCLGAAAWGSAALGHDPAAIRPPRREERPPAQAAEAHRHAYATRFLPRVTGTDTSTRATAAPDAHPAPGTEPQCGGRSGSGTSAAPGTSRA